MMRRSLVAAFTPPALPTRALRRLTATAADTEATSAAAAGTPPKVVKELEVKYSMEDIVGLCKRRGIIFPSSEIYNGYAGFYDYGPLGSEIKKNVKDAWWKYFVMQREDVVGLDSSIIHNPETWRSSGALWHASAEHTHLLKGNIRWLTPLHPTVLFHVTRTRGWLFGSHGGLQGNQVAIPSRSALLCNGDD
jgi:hypothetical protein